MFFGVLCFIWELVESDDGGRHVEIRGFYSSDVDCPIDGTRLTELVGTGFAVYFCQFCDSFYAWRRDDPKALRDQAKDNVERIVRRRDRAVDERERLKLDSLVRSAEERGLLAKDYK